MKMISIVWVVASVGQLCGMEGDRIRPFSIRDACELIDEFSEFEKNKKDTSILQVKMSKFFQAIISDTPDVALQEIASDSSIEKSIRNLSEVVQKILIKELLASGVFPFVDDNNFYIGRKYICRPSKKFSYGLPLCLKGETGTPLFRIQEAPCVYGLYQGVSKKQTLTFNQEPTKIAWDSSGVGCAYLCPDGRYFQSLEKNHGFIKRSLHDTADTLTALALHPFSKSALLGLHKQVKYIFSDNHELVSKSYRSQITDLLPSALS